ncbi:MAG: hypothetical protein KDJ88_21400 [Bauldia sp.]|nr:hypothetical protein [Bauldia sp.]
MTVGTSHKGGATAFIQAPSGKEGHMLFRTIAIAAALAFAGAAAAPIASTAVFARDKGHAEHSGHNDRGDKNHDKKHAEKNGGDRKHDGSHDKHRNGDRKHD